MWLQQSKSASVLDKHPSRESQSSELIIGKGDKVVVPEKEPLTFLEDHLFCAFLGNFAHFTIPPDEHPVHKEETKFVECTQSSQIINNTIPNESNQLMADESKIQEPSLESSKESKHRISKRKSRGSKQPRKSHSFKIPDTTEKILRTIEPEEEETRNVEQDVTQLEDEMNFSHVYEITGENPHLMNCLQEGGLKLDFLNGNTYDGTMCFRNEGEGIGKYNWSDGSRYEGKFANDIPNGEGCMEWSNQSRYEGCFKDGLRDGRGTLVVRSDGTNNYIYTGYWSKGFKSGKGTFKYSELNLYEGNYEQGKYDGRGMRYYKSGGKYLGYWSKGKQHGTGIMLFPNNDMYSGKWVDGKMEGKGKYIWDTFVNTQFVFPMHNTYFGHWKNGMRNGVGSLILSTGAIISTVWLNNKKHGGGRVLCTNGMTIESDPLFINDNLVSMKTIRQMTGTEENEIDENQKSIQDMLDEWNTQNSQCTHGPYKACVIPVNIPPYFMNVDYHLNQFFQLSDWYRRISSTDWTQWTMEMPPGCDKCDYPNIEEEEADLEDGGGDKKVPEDPKERKESNASRVYERSKSIMKNRRAFDACQHRCITYLARKTGMQVHQNTEWKKKPSIKSTHTLLSETIKHDHDIQDYADKVFLFEKKWLRNTIIQHMPKLQKVYYDYATLCCKEKPNFKPGLLRIMLWKLLKDVGFYDSGYSIIEIDNLAVTKSEPFDLVPLSEMIHYLLILAWEIYTKNNKVNRNLLGLIAGGFDLFLTERVYPETSEKAVYGSLFAKCDSIPLEGLYELYMSLGPEPTVKTLVKNLARSRSRDEEKKITILLKDPPAFFSLTIKGQNAILPGGEIFYMAKPLPDFTYVTPEYREMPKDVENVDLKFFSTIGVDQIIDAVIKCCPQIANSAGEILTPNYQICFLEFIDIFVCCIESYLDQTYRYRMDYDYERGRDTMNTCLNRLLNNLKTMLAAESVAVET